MAEHRAEADRAVASVLDIERVEWLSESPQHVLLVVHACWEGPESPGPPALVLSGPGGRRTFPVHRLVRILAGQEAGAATLNAVPESGIRWRAGFLVPIELRGLLGEGTALLLGGEEHPLPAAVPGEAPAPGSEAAPAQVIDHAVLAERRARRAELSDSPLARRAAAAEATLRNVEEHLGHVEQRLLEACEERDRLREGVAEAEAERVRARQREYAEQRLRLEAEEQREAVLRRTRADGAAHRARLRELEEELDALGAELEATRRALAEGQQAASAEQAAVRRAREELARERRRLATDQARLVERMALTRRAERDALGLEDRLGERQQQIERRLAEAERRARELASELAAQRGRRQVPEEQLVQERKGAGGEARLAELERELAHRRSVEEGLVAELALLRSELGRAIGVLEAHSARAEAAERALAELRVSVSALQRELEDRGAAGGARSEARAELAAAQRALAEAGERHREDRREMDRLRAEAELRTRELERAQLEAGRSEAELRALRLAHDRAEEDARNARAQAERSERALHEERRRHAQAEEDEPLAAPLPTELAELHGHLGSLRADLEQAAERLRGQIGPLPEEEPVAGAEPADPERRPFSPSAAAEHSLSDDLDAAVQRLRERVGALPPGAEDPRAPEEAGGEEPGAEVATPAPTDPAQGAGSAAAGSAPPLPVPYIPRVREAPARRGRRPWLALAVRALAAHRQEDLSAELVLALLPAPGAAPRRPLRYRAEIEGHGSWSVLLAAGGGGCEPADGDAAAGELVLLGPPAGFAELAGGGAGRRLPGVRSTGPRRELRRLRRARRRPLTLHELSRAGVRLRPGVLVAALARLIEPRWTVGHRIALALRIEGTTAVHILVEDGAPVVAGEGPASVRPTAALWLGEGALLALLGGAPPPPGERILLEGDRQAVQTVLAWTDRVQGL